MSQLLGKDGYKDDTPVTRSAYITPSFPFLVHRTHKKHKNCFPSTFFFKKNYSPSVVNFGGDRLKSSTIETGYKKASWLTTAASGQSLEHDGIIKSSMDSAYTSDAIVSCNPINQFHGTARSCMCEEIQEAPKVLRPLPKPHAHTPHLPLTTAALAAEDSTGAATVHHLQQPTWRTETRSFFAKPSSRDPPHSTSGWLAGVPRDSGPRGDHVCGPGCPGRPIRSARHQIHPPGTRRKPGTRSGARWSVSLSLGAGSCGSVN
jgi:hypothetical protein